MEPEQTFDAEQEEPAEGSGDPKYDTLNADAGEGPVMENNYVEIFPEDYEDYTLGPVRFIAATDGVNPSVALLMRHDLAQLIKEAIYLQRMYDGMKRSGEAQLEEVERYETQLRREVDERRYAPSNVSADDGNLTPMQKELATLENLSRAVPAEREVIENRLRHKGNQLLQATSEIMKLLDEAFVMARLYEPEIDEEDQTETFDLEQKFRSLHAQDYPEEESALPTPKSEDVCVREKPAEPTPEEVAKHDVMVELWEARKKLETAQQEFDERDDRRSWELHQRRAEEMNSEASFDATEKDFDIRWVACNRELTRNLIDAEEAYDTIEAKAVELGCELPEETEGYYGGETQLQSCRQSAHD